MKTFLKYNKGQWISSICLLVVGGSLVEFVHGGSLGWLFVSFLAIGIANHFKQ